MKRTVFIFFLSLFFIACEEDDICLEGTSPRLGIKFESTDTQTQDSVIIFRKGSDDVFSQVYADTVTDSVYIALRLDDITETQLILSTRTYDTSLYDTLTVSYTPETLFVSKACGYKTVYQDVSYQTTFNFFTELEVLKTEITDESTADILLTY